MEGGGLIQSTYGGERFRSECIVRGVVQVGVHMEGSGSIHKYVRSSNMHQVCGCITFSATLLAAIACTYVACTYVHT